MKSSSKRSLLFVFAATLTAVTGLFLALSTMALAADSYGVDEYTPADIILPYQKTWEDENDADGMRPETLAITLYRFTGDSYTEDDAFMTKTISVSTGWACEFDVTDDAFYTSNDGRYHSYNFAVKEEAIEGYTETAHVDPKVILTVSEGDGAWDRVTPNNQLVHELSTSSYPMSFVVAKKGNKSFVWTPELLSPLEQRMLFAEIRQHESFSGLKFNNAEFLTGFGASSHGMTITSDQIAFESHPNWSEYAVGSYTRSTTDQYAASSTNTHEVVKTSVSVTKVWEDDDDRDGIRPESVTVQLHANGEVAGDPVELNESNGWTYTFEGLNTIKGGQAIEYTIGEITVPEGYTSEISGDAASGFTVTNTHTPHPTPEPDPDPDPDPEPEPTPDPEPNPNPKPKPQPKPQPKPTPQPRVLPRTGDLATEAPLVLAGVAGIAIAAGVAIRRRKLER